MGSATQLSQRTSGFIISVMRIDATEARVLGSLVEKEITTPDYYPLSLNALVNACNQKSSRDPVMELDENDVRQALHSLQEKGLVQGRGDSRVGKYEHRLQEVFNFNRAETAVLCLLLLRGAQTPGELRGRTERLYQFEDLGQVQSTLQRLMERDPPLVSVLPRQPGTKEARYIELLSKDAAAVAVSPVAPTEGRASTSERRSDLEAQVTELKEEVAELRRRLDRLEGM
jgi:uncharacterized protein YceH (UPF0502 family)